MASWMVFYTPFKDKNDWIASNTSSHISSQGARFLKASITFQARKPVLCHFRSKFQKCWKWYMQWNYQLPKQYYPVYELETVLLFKRFWFKNLPSGPKSYWTFREIGLRSVFSEFVRKLAMSNFNFQLPERSKQYRIFFIYF